jgi:hypothetical protein
VDNPVEKRAAVFIQHLSLPSTPFMQGLFKSQVVDFNQALVLIHRKAVTLTITIKHIYKQLT